MPSRRRPPVLRDRRDQALPARSSPGTSSTASTGISPTTRPGASRSTPIPQLTAVGAWRGHGLPVPALLGSGGDAVGRLLQQGGDPRDRRARRPARHRGGAGDRRARPLLRDAAGAAGAARSRARTARYFSVQGFPNNCLNPAREETYRVLETIFDEMIELFPSKIFHVGADEVPLGAWSGSPQALAWLRATRPARRLPRRMPGASTSSPTRMAPTRSRDRARRCCRPSS